MGKKFDETTRITSTSDVTVGDLVDAVAERIEKGSSRKAIEKVVKETVRPCAIGQIPTVVTGDGNTKRFVNGRLRSSAAAAQRTNGCDGSPSEEAIANAGGEGGCARIADPDVPQAEGRHATDGDGDLIRSLAEEEAAERAAGRRVARVKTPQLATTSKWYNMVLQNGEVWTPYTSRRFLPAQYLNLMLIADGNVDAAIARYYNLKDMWRLLDNEIEKLIFMEKHWFSAYCERKHFLPVQTVKEIFEEYLDGLSANINNRALCTFKNSTGEYIRKIQGEGRVVLWKKTDTSDDGDNGYKRDVTTIEPSVWLEDLNGQIATAKVKAKACNTYSELLSVLRVHMPRVSMGTFRDAEGHIRYWLPKTWKAAFKKAGAYYTLKNLVVNCHVRYTTEGGDWRHRVSESCDSAREGLEKMAALIDEDVPGYVVHAILKKSIEASGFNIGKFLRFSRTRKA